MGVVTTNEPLGDELLGLVARLNRWATRQARLEAPPAQVRLLAQINELGPARIGDLAHADHTSQPTMTGQVRRLEENGWARREPDPQDARASLITITPAGAEVLATARRSRAQTLRPVLDQLGEADRARLRDAVEVLRAVVDAATTAEQTLPHEQPQTRRLAPASASRPSRQQTKPHPHLQPQPRK
jgi:DNA-binding MarR family transcriptional regulator